MINKNDLAQAMCDMRKSHRIIYEYQRRVLDLISYIRNKYSLSREIAGHKLFSDPIKNSRGYSNEYGVANLKLPYNMWAWDFLYSYMFEIYFGSDVDKSSKMEYSFSIVQVSDTGYFASTEQSKTKTDTSTFLPCEESESILIFVFEAVPNTKKATYLWGIEKSVNHLCSSAEREEIIDRGAEGAYIAIKYDICDFIDEPSTERILTSFAKVVERYTSIKLIK